MVTCRVINKCCLKFVQALTPLFRAMQFFKLFFFIWLVSADTSSCLRLLFISALACCALACLLLLTYTFQLHSTCLLSKIFLFITGPNLNGRITSNPPPPKNLPPSPKYGDPHTPRKEAPRTTKGGAPPTFLQQTQVLPILRLR